MDDVCAQGMCGSYDIVPRWLDVVGGVNVIMSCRAAIAQFFFLQNLVRTLDCLGWEEGTDCMVCGAPS